MKEKAAIIFDLDGTLADSMPFHDKAWTAAFAEKDIPIRSEDVYESEGERSETFLDRLFERERSRMPTAAERAEILERKEFHFNRIFEVRLFPAVLEVLDALRQADFTLALVSGSRFIRERYAGAPDLIEAFQVIISGDDIQRGKPEPDAFLEAARRLEVKANRCVVVENAPFGIIAASRAGMPSFAVRNNSPLSRETLERYGPEKIFEAVSELSPAEFVRIVNGPDKAYEVGK